MDPWNDGPMDQWTNGPMVQRTNGSMIQWTNRHLKFDILLWLLWNQLHWYCFSNLAWHQLHQWTEWKSEKVAAAAEPKYTIITIKAPVRASNMLLNVELSLVLHVKVLLNKITSCCSVHPNGYGDIDLQTVLFWKLCDTDNLQAEIVFNCAGKWVNFCLFVQSTSKHCPG